MTLMRVMITTVFKGVQLDCWYSCEWVNCQYRGISWHNLVYVGVMVETKWRQFVFRGDNYNNILWIKMLFDTT